VQPLDRFFVFWRTTIVRDREIVDAVVQPEHRAPSPELKEALRRWPGIHYWENSESGRRLVLVRRLDRPVRERWWLHLGLFLITFLTVWIGGALLAGGPVELAPRFSGLGPEQLAASFRQWFRALLPGLDFALGLMAILLAHELGHYFTARWYGIGVSPPYFLPAPPNLNFVGTFGAFIRLRSPVLDRRQLLDVGAAGPWAGFVVSLLVLAVGLRWSQPVDSIGDLAPQLIVIQGNALYLGDSILMRAARELLVGDGTVLLHPLALAGWLGLFVTTLNLLPLGQLDGGHVLYGLLGGAQRRIGWLVWFGLLILGFSFWGWWVWAGFTLLVGRGRLAHPSVLDRNRPIPRSRHPVGWLTVLLFVATFTPVPFYV
jgi:Zn-dependent protease